MKLKPDEIEQIEQEGIVKARYPLRFPARDKNSKIAAAYIQRLIDGFGDRKASAFIRELIARFAVGDISGMGTIDSEEGKLVSFDMADKELEDFLGGL